MFDIAEQLGGKWDSRSGVRIIDGFQFQVEEERRVNSLMWSIEQKIVVKTMEQGFGIEVIKSGGVKEKITDPNENPFLSALWNHQIAEAQRFRLRVGYCVIVPRVIRNPFSAAAEQERREAEQLRREVNLKSNLPQQTAITDATDNPEAANDEEIQRFLQSERKRMDESRPASAPSMKSEEVLGYSVPHVLDPLTECFVKFYIGADGSRVYRAFPRSLETQNTQPIPNSIVIIFKAPDNRGVPQSPFIACLEDLQTARGMLQRWEQRDWINTHPPWVYKSVPRTGGESIIPNETQINFAESGTEEAGVNTVWKGKVRMEDHTLEKRIAQLEASNRYMKDKVEDSVSKAVPPGTPITQPKYNHQLDKLTHVGAIDQFGPYHIIPDQMDLATNIPKPIHSSDWMQVWNILMTRIANATGVMPETFTNDHSVVAADAESRRSEGDSAVRAAQTEIERMIAQIYVAIFMPIHKAEIAAELKQKGHARRSDLLREAETQNSQRLQLRKQIADLEDAFNSTPEDGETRTKLHDEKKARLRDLSDIPQLDIDADEMPWDESKKYTGDRGIQQEADQYQQGDADMYMQIYLETKLQIRVHVRENPSITFSDAKSLFDSKIITRERFGQISLRVLGLPPEYLATEAELDKESTMLAKREKRYNEASGANDLARASTDGNYPKRVKTSDSANPDQGES